MTPHAESASIKPSTTKSARAQRVAESAYLVPGRPGDTVNATFTLQERNTPFRDEFGLFLVDDSSGRIGELRPGETGYALAALKRRQIVFTRNQIAGRVINLNLPTGRYFGTYLIQNGSSKEFLARNPHNVCKDAPRAFFSFPAANPLHLAQVVQVGPDLAGWEDQTHDRDRDYRDEVVKTQFDHQPPVVTIATPPDDLLTRTNTTVSGTVTDDLSGVKSLQGWIDNGPHFAVSFDGAGHFQFDTGLLTDGSDDGAHTVWLQATDNASNVSLPKAVTFTLDTTPPAVSFDLDPSTDSAPVGDHQTTFSTVILVGQTEPFDPVTLVETGATTRADNTGRFSFENVQLAAGANLFHVRAIDAAGNVGEASNAFTLIASPAECVFNDLTGWTTSIQGGTPSGQGTISVQGDRVVLREGDSFQVALEHTFVIPAGATSLSFDYAGLSFDTSSVGTIKDAFEASLVDASGQSLVHTIGAGRDAFFNITEGQSAALGSEASLSGQTVTLNLSGVFAGPTATLVIRLVNNDTDHGTSVAITCVDLPMGASAPPAPLTAPSALSSITTASASTSSAVTGGSVDGAGTTPPASSAATRASSTASLAAYGNLPMSFEANQGQTDPSVKFLSRGSGYTLFLTASEAVMTLANSATASDGSGSATTSESVLRTQLVGASPTPEIVGLNPLPGLSNDFVGSNPSQWQTGITNYAQVQYQNVYPGVDLTYHGQGSQLEYDFTVAPHADPGAITLKFTGADSSEIDAQGNLVLHVGGNEMIEHAPVIYQEIGGVRQAVAGGYVARGDGRLGFSVGRYDPSQPLIIDPVLIYSTYLGGSSDELLEDAYVDAAGDVYLVGSTESTNFPTVNPLQSQNGGGTVINIGSDGFITKLDPTGTRLLYSTYLGGSGPDTVNGIAVDAAGNAYVAGTAGSADFPLKNPMQPTYGGNVDAFVAKLSADGSSLVYSTYLGGSGDDRAFSIATDSSGAAYVTGQTYSDNFPIAHPLQPTLRGSADAFVAKVNPSGTALVYSSYLGGSSLDIASRIAVDGAGAAYVTGLTDSSDFPTLNPIQPGFGGTRDAFVAKLAPDGSSLVYSTYLGGSGEDRGIYIQLDAAGDAYVSGYTLSPDFPTANAFQSVYGGSSTTVHNFEYGDGFAAKLDPTGTSLIFSTYLGSKGDEGVLRTALDTQGDLYLSLITSSQDLPLVHPVQAAYGGGPTDAYVAEFDPSVRTILFSTYFGGSGEEIPWVLLDGSDNVYLVGRTTSTNLTTANALQPTNHGGFDNFVAKIALAMPRIAITAPANGSSFPAGSTVLITGQASAPVTVNNKPVQSVDASGNFFTQVMVSPGQNVFNFISTDRSGQTATATLTLEATQPASGLIDFTNFSDVSASFTGDYARTSFNEDSSILYADLRVRNAGQYPADAPLIVGVKNISDPTVRAVGFDGVMPDGTPYFDFTKLMAGKTLAPGGTTDYQSLQFLDPNRSQFTYDLVFLGKLNQPPAFTSVPVVDAIAGQSYSYAAAANDSDGDALSFSLTTAPAAMRVDAASGQVTWNPTTDDIGNHNITLRVDDGRGGFATQTYVINVATPPPNRPPYFTSVPVVDANVNTAYAYQATAVDPDGNPLTFSVAGGPDGLRIDPQTGLVSWTPSSQELGTQNVSLTVADGQGGTANQSFAILVQQEPGNQRPVIISQPVTTALASAPQILYVTDQGNNSIHRYSTDGTDLGAFSADGNEPLGVVLDKSGNLYVSLYQDDMIRKFSPNGTDLGVFASTGLHQPFGMVFDSAGNLYVANYTASGRGIPGAQGGWIEKFSPSGTDLGQFASGTNTSPFDYLLTNDSTGNLYVDIASESIREFSPTGADLGIFASGFAESNGMAFDQNGDLFVVDSASGGSQGVVHNELWKFSPTGANLGVFANFGSSSPRDVAIDSAGNIYVTLTNGTINPSALDAIRELSPTGQFLRDITGTGLSLPQGLAISPAAAGQPYAYQVKAIDPDNDPLTYSLSTAPQGMSIDPATGLISWAPSSSDVGQQNVTVRVDDGRGGFDTQSYTIDVLANQPPKIVSNPVTNAFAGVPYSYPVKAVDPDGDPLTYSLSTAPSGMTIDPASGLISWSPPSPASFVAQFAVPTPDSHPFGITTGADENLWFGEYSGNKIGVMSPAGVVLAEYAIPTPNSAVNGLTLGPDGNVWFVEGAANKAGKITPSGQITEYPIGAHGDPQFIATGPDGNLWITEYASNRIGRLSPSGEFVEFPTPTPDSTPGGITAGPDGNVWFTEGQGDKIGRITPSGTITEFSIPTANSYPAGITAGPDGNLWFVEETGGKVGRITPSGGITEFDIPTASSEAYSITVGSDGNLWFSEPNVNQIGRITPAGVITEFPIPPFDTTIHQNSNVMITGPDGNLWIARAMGSEIDRVNIASAQPLVPVTVRVDDGHGGSVTQSYSINVSSAAPGEITGTVFQDLGGVPAASRVVVGHDVNTLSSSIAGPNEQKFAVNLADWLTGKTSGKILAVESAPNDSTRNYSPAVIAAMQTAGFTVDVTTSESFTLAQLKAYDAVFVGESFPSITFLDNAVLTQYVRSGGGVYLFGGVGPNPAAEAAGWASFLDTFGFAFATTYNGFFGALPISSTSPIFAGFSTLQAGNGSSIIELTPANPADQILATYSGQTIYVAFDARASGLAGWTVYLDQNQNGRLDPGEPSTTTDQNGTYAFTNLAAGTYTVAEVPQLGWNQTAPATGTYQVPITSGQTVTGIDFGNQQSTTPPVNHPPVFTTTAPTSSTVGQLFRYDAMAIDPDNDPLTYDLVVKPDGMGVDPSTGTVVWFPTASQLGPQDVTLRVQDGRGGVDLQSFTVLVSSANAPPVITSQPTGPAVVGVPWVYQVRAQDAENDPITFSLGAHPDAMTVDPKSGLVTWTPPADQAGQQPLVEITASEPGGGTDTESFQLPVVATASNTPPAITSKPRGSIRLGDTYLYQVVATDPNGDPLTFSLTAKPDGMTIDPVSGLVSWKPTDKQLGANAVTVHVEDTRQAYVEQGFTISVESQSVNHPPSITSNPPQAATVGKLYTYDLKGTDADNDPLVWSLDTAPRGMSIDPTLGTVRWTPTANELGSQNVVVRVIDGQGGSATQTYSITVRSVNLPPSISSVPPTNADTADSYTYAVRATDPENDPLTFSLTTAPTGMTIGAQSGLISWSPAAAQVGSQNVAIQVDDGQGGIATQTYTVVVANAATNQPPVITSTPGQVTTVSQPYQYQVTARDPEGQTLSYVLLVHPDGMSIDATTGLVTWTPTTAQLGSNAVVVGAVDPLGAGGSQSFSIIVNTVNQPPVLDPIARQAVTAGLQFLYDVHASDPDGDALFYSLDSASATRGMIIDGLGRIGWITNKDNVGSYPVTVTVTDALGATASQSFTLLVNADTQAPVVNLVISPDPIDVGQPATIVAQATDNVGVVSRAVTVNGVAVPLDAQGLAAVLNLPGGTYSVVATATDAAGNVGSDTKTLTIIDNSDQNPPTVDITTPADGDTITQPVDVIGTASDANLVSYTLAVAPQGSDSFTTIASGTTSVKSGNLGELDPSSLANGAYDLRLSATDTGGNVATIDETVNVSGNLKVGNFTLSFTDLSIPVSGIPVTLTRTYDSLNANVQDQLGYGWRLEYRDTNLTTSVHPTTPDEQAAGIFNGYQTGTKVYITLPGGQREGFTFEPQLKGGFEGFLGFYDPVFVPDPGVTDQLSVANDYTLMQLDDGSWAGLVDGGELAFNPADALNWGGIFNLTTKDGLAYKIDANTGQLNSVADASGNVVSFTDTSIDSNRGVHITFDLDPEGRIIAAHDPMGNTVKYQYDASGDLVSVTDRSGNVTTFAYDAPGHPHYLTKVIDPLGRTGVRTEYDSQGRLISLIDADGKTVQLAHDPANSIETVTDALGNKTTYEYDPFGNVVKEVDPSGGVTTRTYDDANNMLTETDPLGRTTTYTYDGSGNVLTTTDPLGNVTRDTYVTISPAGLIARAHGARPVTLLASTTDPLGRTTTNTYDGSGNLIATTDAAGNVTKYTYDSAGDQTSITDAAGNVTSFAYDASGHLLSQIDALGHLTSYTYDANGDQLTQTTIVSGRTLVTTTKYDASGHPIAVTDAAGNTTTTQYDALGRQSATIDALGRKTSFVYDARGQLVETDFPDGTKTTTTYDAAGHRISSTDQAGRTSTYHYDPLGRLIETDSSDGSKTTTTYDADGEVTAQTDELNHKTSFTYDAAGRQTMMTGALDNTTTTTYDAAGQQVATTDALGHTTRFVYDALGRLTSTLFADGTTTSTTYDVLGRSIAQTDQLGRVTHYAYDALGRLTGVVDALGQPTSYAYDEAGDLITQTDANHHVTRYEYDVLGHRTATILPLGQRSTTTYDAVGNVASTTDYNGQTITDSYDADNRLIVQHFPNGSSTTYTYTATGQRATVTDSRGVTTYRYDTRDRLLSRKDPDGTTISYTYDAAGNRTSVTIPAGTTTYTFDALNRTATLTDPGGGVTKYTYDADGNLTRTDLPNGTSETRQYDALNRLISLENEGPSGVISSYKYTLAKTNRRDLVVEDTGRTDAYQYDALDRLIEERITEPDGSTRKIDYTYDPVGNRLTMVDSAQGETDYTYNANDELLTATTGGAVTKYTYDANGNTLSKYTSAVDQALYEWDAQNRMIGAKVTDATGTSTIAYQYDADGIRVSSTVNSDVTRYLIDTVQPYAEVLEEYTPGGVINVSYVYGLDLISQNRGGTKSFYSVDGLGSTRALTDASGKVTDRYEYDAFGTMIAQTGNTVNLYLFAGQQRDRSVGLDYLRARYLSVTDGRFYGGDPVAAVQSRPSTLNPFVYAASDPVNRTDWSGRQYTYIESVAAVSLADILSAEFPGLVKGGLLLAAAKFAFQPSFRVRNLGFELLIAAQDDATRNYAVDLIQIGNQLVSKAAVLTRNLEELADFLLIYKDFTDVTIDFANVVRSEPTVWNLSLSLSVVAHVEDELRVIGPNIGLLVRQATTLFAFEKSETTIVTGVEEILKTAVSIESQIVDLALKLWDVHHSA